MRERSSRSDVGLFPGPKSLFLEGFLVWYCFGTNIVRFLGFQTLILFYAEYCVWRLREFLLLFSEQEMCWAKFLWWDSCGAFGSKITFSAYFRFWFFLFVTDEIVLHMTLLFILNTNYCFTDIRLNNRKFCYKQDIQPASTEASKIYKLQYYVALLKRGREAANTQVLNGQWIHAIMH